MEDVALSSSSEFARPVARCRFCGKNLGPVRPRRRTVCTDIDCKQEQDRFYAGHRRGGGSARPRARNLRQVIWALLQSEIPLGPACRKELEIHLATLHESPKFFTS